MIGRAAVALALAISLTAPIAASAQTATKAKTAGVKDGTGGCVYITQLQGNHALGDRSVIFRANVSDFYRLDFAQQCEALTYPDPRLIITPFGGEGLICHALDLDVRVAENGPGSIAEPCITKSFYKLTPAQVAAIPKKDLP